MCIGICIQVVPPELRPAQTTVTKHNVITAEAAIFQSLHSPCSNPCLTRHTHTHTEHVTCTRNVWRRTALCLAVCELC